MRKIYNKIWLYSLFLLSAFGVTAAEYKIGVVHQQVAMENSICGKNYQEHMQKEVDLRQNQLVEKKELVKKKHETLQIDKDILAKKDLENKQKELETLQQDLQKMHETYEVELSNQDQEEQRKLAKLFSKAAANIGKEAKYDLILPINVVFYSSDSVIDITTNVTKELDKLYKEQNKK